MSIAQDVNRLTDMNIDQLSVNTIRTLSIDAVQQAKSGHPGTPMALAPLIYTIWNRVLRFDPQDPIWPNRDRFILSNGHASMLLWSALHLSGTRAVNADYETLGQPSVTLWRGTWVWITFAGFTTTTTSRSRETHVWHSRRMSLHDSLHTDGTF